MNGEIHCPADASTFDVAIAAIKMLQDEYGAVVTDVDVIPEGTQFSLKLPSEQRLLRLRARQRTLELAAERTKERLEFCRQLALAIDHQRVEIAHQRVEIAWLQEWLASVMASL